MTRIPSIKPDADDAPALEIRYYTDRTTDRLLARFACIIAAPWGRQTVCGEIHLWHSTGQRRVLWPKGATLYHTTPETPSDTDAAERMILADFAAWERGR